MRRSYIYLTVSLTITLGSILASNDVKTPMTLVDLIEIPRLSDPRLSPDGSQVIYSLSEPDWKKNRSISHIWRVNADGTQSVRLTNGERGESRARWAPDGSGVSFLARRGDDEVNQIYLISNRGGEAARLTSHETAVTNYSWSPDGAFIYFVAAEPKSKEEEKRDKAKDDVFAFDENYKQRHLWRYEISDRSEESVTEGDFSVLQYRLSAEGQKIVFSRGPTPLFDDRDESEIWIMDGDGGNQKRLTENTVTERGGELSPDGDQVLFLTGSNRDFETYYNGNLFLVPAGGGEIEMLLEDLPHDIRSASWSPDGKSIYFAANMGLRTELFQVDSNGDNVRQLTDGKHNVRSWNWHSTARMHVFTLAQPDNPGDIWTLSNVSPNPTRVSHVYDYLTREFQIPKQEKVQWKGADGVTVEGLVYYPLDYREGTRYPLVVQTHGGPASSDKYGFPGGRNSISVLAKLGYFVFKPNYRGSTGYGDDFLRDMVGHYFKNAHLDVMAGVDHLIAQGLVDGDRMAKMGWSAGGHMTNKIITFTDRFKAASSGAGAVNWISMYGQSDVRIYRTPWFNGTPWQRDAPIETYWENSPLKDIWKVKTPTIILVGENDVRVPPPQSVELYRALKTNGVDTHLYIAPREPHGWRELRHALFKMNVELDWFEKHVMQRDYEWEEAPGAE